MPVYCSIPQNAKKRRLGWESVVLFCFIQATWELVLLANMRMHNLHIISFLPLTMYNRKIVDTISPCKIIRSAETISFLVESRLSKNMLMVNAAIYPSIKFFNYFTLKIPHRIYKSFKQFYLLLLPLYYPYLTIHMAKDKFMEARTWALRIKTWMFERKARVPVDLQTH